MKTTNPTLLVLASIVIIETVLSSPIPTPMFNRKSGRNKAPSEGSNYKRIDNSLTSSEIEALTK